MSRLESSRETLQEKKTELEHDLYATQKELAPLKEGYEGAMNEIDALNRDVNEANTKITQLELLLDKEQKARSKMELEKEGELSKLNKNDEELLRVQRKLVE